MEISIMKTNKWILGGLMAMAITACTSDELVENTNPTQGKKVTVTAYAPGDEANSRVSFADDNTSKVTLSWNDTESFSVVYHTTAQTFSKTTAGNTFTGVLPYDNNHYADCYYAVYPALSANTSLTTANTVPFDLSTQTGALDESKTYMRAESENGLSYSFEHCTAILKATFAGIPEGAKISKVVVKTSHEDSKVDGNLDLATGEITGGSENTITINYPTPVDASTPVYIYLPPMAANKKGLEFQVITTDDKTYTGTLGAASTPQSSDGESSNANQDEGIVAGNLYTATIKLDTYTPYVTFRVGENQTQTLCLSKHRKELSYSIDNGVNWTPFPETKKVQFGNGNDLLLRGEFVDNATLSCTISFEDKSVKVECFGDIRTLYNYTNYADVNAKNYYALFRNCTNLISAPELPATTLVAGCYECMFEGCTSLVSAPELPATTLAEECYYSMFFGCTSLKSAPELPATTLAEECYYNMFYGCTSLKSAPELPATTLAESCYYYMFAACTSLVSAPELPAKTLAKACYRYMFAGCTSLVTAPELPATTLAEECYYYMFGECTSLQTSPVLSPVEVKSKSLSYMFYKCRKLNKITWLADGNLLNEDNSGSWVLYVPSTGSFYKLKDEYVSRGSDACPSGWTVVDYEEQEK